MATSSIAQKTGHEPWRLRGEEKPLRAEPFSEDHLAQHARELAGLIQISDTKATGVGFLERFSENASFLRSAIQKIARAEQEGLAHRSDSEWLLDNFYIIEEQLREIYDDLPRRYFHELPKTTAGEPRVYLLALELITHTDSVLNEETIVRFITEFESVAPLSIGEIWAVPIMLRLVLTENLRRIATQILCAQASEVKAAELVENWREGEELPLEIKPVHEFGSLIFHLIERLQQESTAYLERFRELERRLAAHDLTVQHSVHLEHQRQASSQVSIGNVITSMRLISAIDWVALFERTSLVEQILRDDPSGMYPRMDLASRDRYRHVIEELAKGSKYSETDIAEHAIKLANKSSEEVPQNHIGYWLIGEGRQRLETDLNFRQKFRPATLRWAKRHPYLTYLGGISLVFVASLFLMNSMLASAGVVLGWRILLLVLAALPASDFAVRVMNSLVTSFVPPWLMPKMDFSKGIPDQQRTMVVVPAMLSNSNEVESLVRRLEMHYLANPDPVLRFALLTDYPDANAVEMPTDAELLRQATDGIAALNEQYRGEKSKIFFLLHRKRRWNEQEGVWMGWERKRGKLMEFNRILRGDRNTSYINATDFIDSLASEPEPLPVRYVITLDSDTALPHGVAQKLIATMSHPLNVPTFDDNSNRVRSGYVLLQPRVTANLASVQRSRFSRIFANHPGIDPYSTCASDVYQDLFGEGSFTGKGIYDVDAFERALKEAFPENQILSHDLIEGCYSRVGLVSDIELFDNYPPSYEADAKRQHRWVRGDWQISPWLLPVVPSEKGHRANQLSVLSRWKIFDNLRRSLVPPTLLAFLVVGWVVAPQSAWLFTAGGLILLCLTTIAPLMAVFRGRPRHISFWEHLKGLQTDLEHTVLQSVITIALLPYKAVMMVDAVARTLVRILGTHRKMLEWETASDVERRLSLRAKTNSSASSIWSKWLMMSVMAVAVGLCLDRYAALSAMPFLIAWLVAPLLVEWIHRPAFAKLDVPLTSSEKQRLRVEARKIWAFFQTYVTQQDHFLPPDNVQEYPQEKIAHRISPTNEGLFLVSGLVARDLGFVSMSSMVELWERNLASWTQFDRLNGHFYNWYDTVTMQPLFPRYVSTVDSGNLLACYLTLQQGIEELHGAAIFGRHLSDGIGDTIEMIRDTGRILHFKDDRQVLPLWTPLVESLNRFESLFANVPADVLAWQSTMESWTSAREEITTKLEALIPVLSDGRLCVVFQTQLLLELTESLSQEMATLFPWVAVVRHGLAGTEQSTSGTPQLRWAPSSKAIETTWEELWTLLRSANTLPHLQSLSSRAGQVLDELKLAISDVSGLSDGSSGGQTATEWVDELKASIESGSKAAEVLHGRLQRVSDTVADLAQATDFRMLYNENRKLFSIGFNLEDNRLDSAHYDLLCSEARLASFLAIARGDVDVKHWFKLGRQMTHTADQLSLLSWGGTMFEFLMPQLFMNCYESALLTTTCQAAVARQQEYGRQRGVPWGISECGFGALAANSDYHYRSFGVPGLGLKRGLSKDLVISPYSTFLALDIDAQGALSNLSSLEKEGACGPWGYYEALDYTRERVPVGKRAITVRSYMAHHYGMSMLALGNLLVANDTRRRFSSHTLVRSTELLLQERVPAVMPKIEPHADELSGPVPVAVDDQMVSRRIVGVCTTSPRVQLLSNGEYSLMLTSNGGGYSQYKDIAVTRWRSDPTRDHWGQFIYLRDVSAGRVWSATYQPTCVEPTRYEVIYSIDKAEFLRRDGQIETCLEVVVSPESNSEVRQLKITNSSPTARRIELTSYAEIPLIDRAADIAHPSFQKLFIETEYLPDKTALLAKRRTREANQPQIWAVHSIAADPDVMSEIQFETSRQQFLGRNGTCQKPHALNPGISLTETTGAVLDPIFSLRCQVTVPPNGTASVAFVTSVASSREEAIALADQYHDPRGVHRAFELAWAYAQVELRYLHMLPANMHLYQRLVSAMIYPEKLLRANEDRLSQNTQGQRSLWRFGISGDNPMQVVYITKPEHIELVRDTLRAHRLWKDRGLKTDLIVINDFPGSYFDAIQERLLELFQELQVRLDEKPASVFLLRGAHLPAEDKILLEAVASVVLHGDQGTLARQLERKVDGRLARPQAALPQSPAKIKPADEVFPTHLRTKGDDGGKPWLRPRFEVTTSKDLEFWNETGGFAEQGAEYHICLTPGRTTPMPWSNVIASPKFGCLITESGGGFTWFGNSRENKITNWSNDPVSDPCSEMIYLVDQDSNELFSPWTGAVRDEGDYWIHHGQGYSRFIHRSNQLAQEVFVSIAPEDTVKFVVVTLRNERKQRRRIGVTYFVEWILGVTREQTQMHLMTSVDQETGALLAKSLYQSDRSSQVVFLHASHGERSVCGDRTEFFGRNGSPRKPAALGRGPLSGRTGIGLDPCGAVQSIVQMEPGEEVELVFLVGAAASAADASQLIKRYDNPRQIREAANQTIGSWDHLLETIQIETPNRAFDILVNRWLLYQTLSCRVWGRSAFYQCGGAFGFRDQLQDVAALLYSRPDLARNHILLAASRQFEEGDVQHWWHPPEGNGTRTRFSDDLLWLPYVVCQYLSVTNDETLLDESISFLHSPQLTEHEQERYETPRVSEEKASIYEHCRRTILRAFQIGAHGIPLMGCGDWNDGMNKVGEGGKGESVWVGWFLLVILDRFLPLVEKRGSAEEANELRNRAAALRKAIEENCWDGKWYRRAYFDDGTPLGSSQNDECQIDSLAQTWAVIAGGEARRSRTAIDSVMDRLVLDKNKMVLLFTPAFNESKLDPGYIKGYVPGIRENGGQYTHAAAWLVQALSMMGDGDRAVQVYDFINPIHHTATRDETLRYQVEPYVVAADVYNAPQHVGRGGWTWYTGSAAWLYRVAIESILGFHVHGKSVRFAPQIPNEWEEFRLRFRFGSKMLKFRIVNRLAAKTESDVAAEDRHTTGEFISIGDKTGSNEILVQRTEETKSNPTNPSSPAPAVWQPPAQNGNSALVEHAQQTDTVAPLSQEVPTT